MKKLISLVILLLFLSPIAFAQNDNAYIFAYFQHRKQDGLHLAYSLDGLSWKPLFGGKAVFNPKVGSEKMFRDPCLFRGPDNIFRLVWTTGGHGRDLGYASSKDLIHWSQPKVIPVMENRPTALNVWAPEIFYDPKTRVYYIYWSSTIPGRYKFYSCNPGDTEWNNRIYYVTTKDFKTFSSTALFYNPNFNIIDASIIADPKKRDLIMVMKNENSDQKNIRMVRSIDIAKGFKTKVSKSISGPYAAEGPCLLWVGDTLYLYFDRFREGKYGAARSLDRGKTWTDVTPQTSFPNLMSHGSALQIPYTMLRKLLHF